MNFDNLVKCSRCDSNFCYVQEINKDITIESCFGCGFVSNSLMKRDTQFFKEQTDLLPQLYKSLMDEEEDTGKIWMPNHIQVEGKGMVFANGTSRDNWVWTAAKDVLVTEEEKDKYKGKKYRTDLEVSENFEPSNFIGALDYIEILKG